MKPLTLPLLLTLLFVCHFSASGQAPRPPIQTLSGLTGDVNIATPANLQPLRYDTATSKWINSSTLGDIIVFDSANGSNAADFTTQILSSKGVYVLDWSNSKLTPLVPISDNTGIAAADTTLRKLYKTDGTTVLFDWSGTNPKFPTLTNSASNAFLKTDASGNVSVATVPSAGTIPATYAILAGDGAGNAIPSYFDFANGAAVTTWTLSGDFKTGVGVQNTGTGTSSETAIFLRANGGDEASFSLWSSASNPPAGINAGELEVRHNGNPPAGAGIVLNTSGVGAGHPIRFVTFSGEVARFGDNGFMVGTTTDPGAGVVNVSSGYRIANAAPYFHSLVSTDGVSYKDGSVPGKASVTSTVDQTATAETAHVVYTVPANSVSVGTVFRIHASGNVDNGTTAITFTPRIRWGGTGGVSLLATPAFASSTSANTNRAYELTAYVTIRTIGAAGTAVAEMEYTERSSNALGQEVIHTDNSGATPVTIDTTTANKDLVLSWTLSTTTGTPHLRTISGTVEVVKP